MKTTPSLETHRRERLRHEYVNQIGYDPFEDDPSITETEVENILEEYADTLKLNRVLRDATDPREQESYIVWYTGLDNRMRDTTVLAWDEEDALERCSEFVQFNCTSVVKASRFWEGAKEATK